MKARYIQDGLEEKEYKKFVEDVLLGQLAGDPEILSRLNENQKDWYDTTRKGRARLKDKNSR